jgi:hypothetical protein
MKLFTHILPITLACLVVPCASAQTAQNATPREESLASFLARGARPLRLRFTDLTPRYRRVIITPRGDAFQTYIQTMMAQSGVPITPYFTSGETVSIGEETYLVAYRAQDNTDFTALRNSPREAVTASRPAPNDELLLSLLNLRTIGALSDVRPFDPARDLMSASEGNAASLRALVSLGRGLLEGIGAHGGVVPVFTTPLSASTRAVFQPFVRNDRAWQDPRSGEFYTPNPKISGLVLADVLNASYLPALMEKDFAKDGTRGILFLDGHAERITRERWQRIAAVVPHVR